MYEKHTFETIKLGASVTYRSSSGIMKTGRVVRKQEKFIKKWIRNPDLRKTRNKPLEEVVRVSIMVEVANEKGWFESRVNLTQFDNVRQVINP